MEQRIIFSFFPGKGKTCGQDPLHAHQLVCVAYLNLCLAPQDLSFMRVWWASSKLSPWTQKSTTFAFQRTPPAQKAVRDLWLRQSGEGSILGVDSPFFSAIVLFKHRSPLPLGFWRFSRKEDAWKEWKWKLPLEAWQEPWVNPGPVKREPEFFRVWEVPYWLLVAGIAFPPCFHDWFFMKKQDPPPTSATSVPEKLSIFLGGSQPSP